MIDQKLQVKWNNGRITTEERAIYLEQMTNDEMWSLYDKMFKNDPCKTEGRREADFLMTCWNAVQSGPEKLHFCRYLINFDIEKYNALKAKI